MEPITTWTFSIQDKELLCSFYPDESCDFYSWQDRNDQAKSDPNIFIKGLLGDVNAKKRIQAHVSEFTITVDEIDQAIVRAVQEIDQKLENEEEVTSEDERMVDDMIEPFFWKHVNNLLTEPLTKRA